MAKQSNLDGGSEWVTIVEAAQRLSMSPSWFKTFAETEGIEVGRRGRKPGVRWAEVEVAIARSRIVKIDERLTRGTDPERPISGVDLLDRIKARFDWSDQDIALALAVWPSAVSRWRLNGVPGTQELRLQELVSQSPRDVRRPKRIEWATSAEWAEARKRSAGRWPSN